MILLRSTLPILSLHISRRNVDRHPILHASKMLLCNVSLTVNFFVLTYSQLFFARAHRTCELSGWGRINGKPSWISTFTTT